MDWYILSINADNFQRSVADIDLTLHSPRLRLSTSAALSRPERSPTLLLGAVHVRVPWHNLGSEPMLISVKSLTLLLAPLASSAAVASAAAREAANAARARGARRVGGGPRGGGQHVMGCAGRQAHAPSAAEARGRGERAARACAARHRRRRTRGGRSAPLAAHRRHAAADIMPQRRARIT